MPVWPGDYRLSGGRFSNDFSTCSCVNCADAWWLTILSRGLSDRPVRAPGGHLPASTRPGIPHLLPWGPVRLRLGRPGDLPGKPEREDRAVIAVLDGAGFRSPTRRVRMAARWAGAGNVVSCRCAGVASVCR